MANRTQIVDPNNVNGVNSIYNNVPVPLEDLTISVQLSVDKKNRSILTTDKQGSFVQTEKGVSVKFIEGSQVGPNKSLTTKYTDLTSRLTEPNNDEVLGITAIDIDFNSSYAPQITIQFVDVRGSAIFQNEDRISKGTNKYSVFFQLPYPLYKLSIKGYYGQQVEYCLHMIKFNSRFNSQTGNFEITAQFVGYTYAMLSDALIGYMRAIPYTTLGKKKYEELKKESETPLLTLDELYQAISKINEQIDGLIATSPQADELKNATNKLNELDAVRNNVINFNETLLTRLTTPSASNTHLFTIYDSEQSQLVQNDIEKYCKDVTEAINTYNKNSKINLDVSLFTDVSFNSYLIGNIKKSDADETSKRINEYLNKNEVALADTKTINVISNKVKLDKLAETEITLKQDIDILKQNLAKELDTTVSGNIGFTPTVRNLIKMITTSIEVLFYVIYKVSEKAETEIKRKNLLEKVFSNKVFSTDIKPDNPIYPWPAYRKYDQINGYEESFLGEIPDVSDTDKLDITEVDFINELLKAFLQSEKNLETVQKNLKQNLKNWFADNTIDTRIFVNTQPYARENSISDSDIIRMIMLRAITFLGVSNKKLRNDEIIKIAEAEYEAVISATPNKIVLNTLPNKKLNDYLNITGTYKVSDSSDNITKKLIKDSNNSYVYDYITNRINNTDVSIIPISNQFNNGIWPENYPDLLDKYKNDGVLFLTNFTYTDANLNVSKPDDGSIYVNIITPEEYDSNSSNSLPNVNNIQPIDLGKLVNGDTTTFDVFAGPYGIQSFKLLNYTGINTTVNGKSEEITNFDYRYIFYASDSSKTVGSNEYQDKKKIKANGFGYTRKDSGDKNIPTTSIYDIYSWKNNSWVQKDKYEIAFGQEGLNTYYFDYKEVNTHKYYGKNLDLIYQSSRGGKEIVYPYFDFAVVDEKNVLAANVVVPISLFGSRLYYEQTDDKAKAILFLHTFPWKGLIQSDRTGKDISIFDMGEILHSFDERAGFVSVPKLWVYFIGGMLWRSQQTTDPIKFYKTNLSGNIIESYLPTFIDNNPNTYPNVNQFLLYQDPFKLDSKVQFGMLFREEADNDYKKIDNAILNLPDQVKNEFISKFEDFVNNDWETLKSQLQIFSGDGASWVTKYNYITNLNNNVIKKEIVNASTNYYAVSSLMNSNFENFNNYIIFTPFYNSGGDSSYNYNIWLELKDEADITKKIVDYYKEELIIANSTYRIWSNKVTTNDSSARKEISVSKDDLKTYLTTIINKFSGQTELYGSNEDKEKKQAIFGTVNDGLIKLQLYKNCKNIYDKWLAGAKNVDSIFFQCGGENNSPTHIIDSFRFLTRSFRDIGDEMAINPFPIIDYLSDNISSSSYDMITSLLSSNYFNFVPLPNFINYRDKNMVDSIFTPFPTYGNFFGNTYGPTFVCTYVGEKSKILDFGDSNYITDGFDISDEKIVDLPEDFTGSLGDNPNDEPVTVFKVVYGQQNQNLFKDIVLDQSEFSESAESLQIMEDISQRGSPKYRTLGGQNMYDVWSVRSYSAQIEMMGNAMIQPMMYFQLDNIPLFHGAYMITRVKHSIKPNHMSTNFTGVKIRRPTTKIFTVGDFYMSLLESIETKPTSGTGGPVGTGLVSGAYPPIIATLIGTNAFNGNFNSVQVDGNKLVKVNSLPKGIDFSSVEDSKRYLIPQAADSLNKMLTDWVSWMSSQGKFKDSAGIYALVTSMFRTFNEQQELYDSYNGVGVAEPGTSRHGWGIAVDFQFHKANGDLIKNRIDKQPNVTEGFDYTINESLVWLIENSYSYGWILPYKLRSGGKSDEFWHFEYHGTSAKCLISKNNTFRGPNGVKGSKTVDINKTYIQGVVKNPLNLDGKEAVYNDTDCSDKEIGKTDGTGDITSEAYPNVLPTNEQITTINNLSGTWDKRAETFIKQFEGFNKETKWDVNAYRGGYGTDIIITSVGAIPQKATKTTRYTQQTADLTLQYDINNRYKTSVIGILGQTNWDKLNDNQKASVISYSYNAGAGKLKTKGIVDAITNNDFKKASKLIFGGPITAGGKILTGLIRRRKSESLLFDKSV